jgi:hypothetical protein
MKNHVWMPLLALAALPASAQSYPFTVLDTDISAGGNNSALLTSSGGVLTIDPNAGTVATVGTLAIPDLSWSSSQTKTVSVSRPFPFHATTYTDILTVNYTLYGGAQSLASAATVPTPLGGDLWQTGPLAAGPVLTVGFNYVVKENGTTITSGSGHYLVQASASPLTIDDSNYPTTEPVFGLRETLTPIIGGAGAAIIDYTSPAGAHFSVNGPELFSTVPEPANVAAFSALGMLAFGAARRFSGRRQNQA